MSPGLRATLRADTPGSRACDVLVVAYAVWTLVCNVTVWNGGGLSQLLRTAGAALGLAVVGALIVWRRTSRRSGRLAGADPLDPQNLPPPTLLFDRHTAVALTGAIAICALYVARVDVRLLWAAAVLNLLYHGARALARAARGPTPASWDTDPRPASRLQVGVVWALALGAGTLPLFAHRYNYDDTFYVNLAVAAVDDPHAPLLAYDTLHGVADLPIMYATYKVSSYELLGAAIAAISPLTALEACHWVLPAVFGLFMVLAHARLLRRLVPEAWLGCLAVTLAVLLLVAEAPQFYGGFTLLRMQQGKSAFLSVIIPLLIVYASRFAERPTWASAALLAAAQVAGMGMTSTAIWLAPVVSGLTLCGSVRLERKSLLTVLAGCATSIYVVIAGLVLRRASLEEIQAEAAHMPLRGSELLADAWTRVVGDGAVSVVCMAAGLSAFCFLRQPGARRVALALSLGMLVFFNPFAAQEIAEGITGPPTFWRTLWIAPLPVFVAVLLCAALLWSRPRSSRRGRWIVTAALTAAFVIAAPRTQDRSDEQRIRWEPLGLDVDPPAYKVAMALRRRAPAGSPVLAPVRVSCALVTLHDHPVPVATRQHYLDIQRSRLGAKNTDRRERMMNHISGVAPLTAAEFRRAVRNMELTAVCFQGRLEESDDTRRALTQLGFEQLHEELPWETWTLPPRQARER